MTGGVATGLAEALAEVPSAEEVVQGALFDLDEGAVGALDVQSPLAAAVPAANRRGRKPGSQNKSTEATRRWLLSQARHPLLTMLEATTMTPAQLAAQIGLRKATVEVVEEFTDASGKVRKITRHEETDHYENAVLLDLLKLQMKMAEAVAPYVAQKLPQALSVEGGVGLTLAFGGVSFPARGGSPVAGGPVVEGQVMAVNLSKSDEASRTGD